MTYLEVLQAYGEAVGSSVERKLNRPCCSAPWPCHTKVDQPGTLCYKCETESNERARRELLARLP